MALLKLNRITVKLGTKSISCDDGSIDEKLIEHVVDSTIELRKLGANVTLVTSGAKGMGMSRMRLTDGDEDTNKQVYCAVGQPILMGLYGKYFKEKHNTEIGQFLPTRETFEDIERYKSMSQVYERCLEKKIVPIFNENDTLSVEEIKIGDNDSLASLVAEKFKQDIVMFMTRYEGLVHNRETVSNPTKDSHICFSHEFYDNKQELEEGLKIKLSKVAYIVNQLKKPCIIARLDRNYSFLDIINGENKKGEKVKSSLFLPEKEQEEYRQMLNNSKSA